MTNYDMDEIDRQRERERRSRGIRPEDGDHSVKIGKDSRELEIELPSDDLLILALAAHDRNITLNQLVNNVLRDSLKDLEYRFEHQSKPQLLNEDK